MQGWWRARGPIHRRFRADDRATPRARSGSRRAPAGNARPAEALPPLPVGGRGTFDDATLRFDDGGSWTVTVVAATAPAGLVPRGFVLAAPDRARAATLGDLARTIPLVALVVLVVGGPLAWVLARSTTGPFAATAPRHRRCPRTGRAKCAS
jgi:hypothetical protein